MGWITATVGTVGVLAGVAVTAAAAPVTLGAAAVVVTVGGVAGTVIGATAEYTAKSKLVLHSHVHIVTLHR